MKDVWRRAEFAPRSLRILAEADAFAGLGMSRRDPVWAAKALSGDAPLPLFGGDLDGEGIVEPAAHLPAMTAGEEVVEDYVAMRLTLRAHPMSFLRARLTAAVPSPAPSPLPSGRRLADAKGLARSDAWPASGEGSSGKCVTTRD